jgi:hypothetical protein
MSGEKLYDKAKQESASNRWRRILDTVERRVRFEDGYVAGFRAGQKNAARYGKKGRKR